MIKAILKFCITKQLFEIVELNTQLSLVKFFGAIPQETQQNAPLKIDF